MIKLPSRYFKGMAIKIKNKYEIPSIYEISLKFKNSKLFQKWLWDYKVISAVDISMNCIVDQQYGSRDYG